MPLLGTDTDEWICSSAIRPVNVMSREGSQAGDTIPESRRFWAMMNDSFLLWFDLGPSFRGEREGGRMGVYSFEEELPLPGGRRTGLWEDGDTRDRCECHSADVRMPRRQYPIAENNAR